jgi:peptide/nickel transport system substrate-binding protein
MNFKKCLLVLLSLAFVVGAAWAGGQSEKAGTTGTATAAETQGLESPVLAEMVEAGELPPLEERIPKQPYVVENGSLVDKSFLTMENGTFGGTLRLAQEGPNGDPVIFIGLNEPLLWAPSGFQYDQGIEGNILEDYTVSEDDTVYTLTLREGLKWSDGEPVTTEDVDFAFNDVLLNEELVPVFPIWLRTGNSGSGELPTLDIIDDYTFRFTFAEPYGSFLAQLAIAQWRSWMELIKPAHFAKQFHIDYGDPDEIERMMKEESIEEGWYNLFTTKVFMGGWGVTTEKAIGHPSLAAWNMVRAESGVFTYDRNPYYFKVDSDGRQLPYIDRIRSEVVQDKETLTLRGLMGQYDYLGERASMKNLALFKEKEQVEGEIKVVINKMHRYPIAFFLNLTNEDTAWREVTWDKRFREALNLAIDREEIIETFYLNFASMAESFPSEYDPDKANQLLDEMGLDERDSEGYRLGPDGERFTVPFEVFGHSEDIVPMTELFAEWWKEIGIYTTVKTQDWQLIIQRWNANESYGMTIWAHENIWNSAGWDDYLPGNFWGQAWHQWFVTGGEGGEEPIEPVKELYDLHSRFLSERVGTQASQQAIQRIRENLYENIWFFAPVEDAYYPTFFTKNMGNVPDSGQYEGLGIMLNYSMEQWFYK